VHPFLNGNDILTSPYQAPSRHVIDFGSLPLEEASRFEAAISIVRDRVKPVRERNHRENYRRYWWRFGEVRPGMRRAVNGLARFASSNRVGKRLILSWSEAGTVPSDQVVVYGFDDDYSMGVLTSRAHVAWAWARSSTLETRLRYTPSSVFETFPFPDPVSETQREGVAEASRRLLARRSEICLAEGIGLTKLYNQVDDGAWTDLAALHRDLDAAVAAAYGWPAAAAQDDQELVRRLTELNRQITEGGRAYDPFATAAG
jgi:hypothetical protein